MKRIVPSLLAMAFLAPAGRADACDCTIYPFSPDPPCQRTCTGFLIGAATAGDLLGMGLSPSLVAKISAVPQAQRPKTIHGWGQRLSEAEMAELEAGVSKLSPSARSSLIERAHAAGLNPTQVPSGVPGPTPATDDP